METQLKIASVDIRNVQGRTITDIEIVLANDTNKIMARATLITDPELKLEKKFENLIKQLMK